MTPFFPRFCIGELIHIGNLRPWDLYSVLTQKYSWSPKDARSFADFLTPMLAYDTRRRATALDCLKHTWIQHEIDSTSTSERKKKGAHSKSESSRTNQELGTKHQDRDYNRDDQQKHKHDTKSNKKLVHDDHEHSTSVRPIQGGASNEIISLERCKSQVDYVKEDSTKT